MAPGPGLVGAHHARPAENFGDFAAQGPGRNGPGIGEAGERGARRADARDIRQRKAERILAGEIPCARPECENPVPAKDRKYCSAACASLAMRKPLAVCPVCNATMTEKQTQSRQQTCSRICGGALPTSRGDRRDESFRAKVFQLWEVEGKKLSEIELKLHVSKNVIVGLVRRMGLSKRPSGRWPEGYVPKETRPIARNVVPRYSNGGLKSQSGETKRHLSDVKTVADYEKISEKRKAVEAYRRSLQENRPPALTAPHVTHPRTAKIEAAKAKAVSPVRVAGIPGNGCQFPLSESPWRICDDPRVPYGDGRPGLSSYCELHRDLCFSHAPRKPLKVAA